MTRKKEIGYDIGNVAWNNLEGYERLWRDADFDTKEHIVNEQGRLAIELSIPVISPRFFAFAEWAASNYIRLHGTWVHKFSDQRKEENHINTEELWERYNKMSPSDD